MQVCVYSGNHKRERERESVCVCVCERSGAARAVPVRARRRAAQRRRRLASDRPVCAQRPTSTSWLTLSFDPILSPSPPPGRRAGRPDFGRNGGGSGGKGGFWKGGGECQAPWPDAGRESESESKRGGGWGGEKETDRVAGACGRRGVPLRAEYNPDPPPPASPPPRTLCPGGQMGG